MVTPKIPARIEQIRALGAPEGDEQQVEEFLVSLQDIVNAPQSRFAQVLRHSTELAQGYGLQKCAYLL